MAPFGARPTASTQQRLSANPFLEARLAAMQRASTKRFQTQRASTVDTSTLETKKRDMQSSLMVNTKSKAKSARLNSECMSHMKSDRKKSHAVFVQKLEFADPDYATTTHADKVYGQDFAASLFDEVDQQVAQNDSFGYRLRARLAHLIMSQRFEMFVGLIIITNFMVIAFETDARARKENNAPATPDYEFAQSSLDVISVINIFYLLLYTVECAVRMYVLRWDYFRHMWNNFDLACVVAGVLAEIMGAVATQLSNVETPQGLRTLRTVRMLRASRVLVSFDELYALVSGLKNAMKTLMWAGGLMLMVLTMWSILAVEFVKPYMAAIALDNGFDQCSWCPRAFDTVAQANLTFFQIISGDGWSHVARPLIEAHPWTALLFIAVIFSMMFGLLNLIVAVIVDSAHQAREADIMNMAAKKDAARAAAWDCFSDMVGELDENGDGLISVEELSNGLMSSHDLAAYLTVMGIEQQDLEMVFELLDRDGDGYVTHDDFTHQLYQMKTQELPITMCYIRAGVSKLHLELERVSDNIRQKLDEMLGPKIDVASRLEEVSNITSALSSQVAQVANTGKRLGFFVAAEQEKEKPEQSEEHEARKGRRKSLFAGKPPPSLRTMKSAKTREFKDKELKDSVRSDDQADRKLEKMNTNKDLQTRGDSMHFSEMDSLQSADVNEFSAVVVSKVTVSQHEPPKRCGTNFIDMASLPGTSDDQDDQDDTKDDLQCDEIE